MIENKSKQNFPLAVLGGFIALIAAAALWALATSVTGFRLVFMPILVGFIVGFAVRLWGKGVTFPFGLVGAVFTLPGCFLGHFLAMIARIASARGISMFSILVSLPSLQINEEVLAESFGTTELLLYAAAVCIGFILSFYRFSSKKNLQPVKT